MLGKGSYGTVTREGDYAIKRYRHQLCSSALREVALITSVEHPNLLSAIEVRLHPEGSYLKLPLARSNLDEMMNVSSDLTVVRDRLHDVLCGLQVLHRRGLVHGDLNPYNILIFDDHAKLADFGSVSPPCQGNVVTTFPWRAPESLRDEAHDFPIDLWSVGIVLRTWLTGKDPKGMTWDNPLKLLRHHLATFGCPDSWKSSLPLDWKYRPPRELSLPSYHRSWEVLLNGLLQVDPSKRLTVDQALSSSLFTGLEQPEAVWRTRSVIEPSEPEVERSLHECLKWNNEATFHPRLCEVLAEKGYRLRGK